MYQQGRVELAIWLQLVEQAANNELEFVDSILLEYATIEALEGEMAL